MTRVRILSSSRSTVTNVGRNGESVRRAAASSRRIRLLEQNLPAEEVQSLIQHAIAFVSLHRSEGFGLGLMEAMAAGTPVVATGYSGNPEFMSRDNSILIEATQIPVTESGGYYRGLGHWADPDEARGCRSLCGDWLRTAPSQQSWAPEDRPTCWSDSRWTALLTSSLVGSPTSRRHHHRSHHPPPRPSPSGAGDGQGSGAPHRVEARGVEGGFCDPSSASDHQSKVDARASRSLPTELLRPTFLPSHASAGVRPGAREQLGGSGRQPSTES